MDFILNKKQIGLITENSDRTQKLVQSLFRKGHSLDMIYTITGLPKQIVLKSLYDEVITSQNDTNTIWNLLYHYLWKEGLLDKKRVYDDGSYVELYYDHFSGSLEYEYKTKNGNKIHGYATLLWDGGPDFPVDGTEFTFNNGEFSYYDISAGNFYGDIKKYIPKNVTIRGLEKLFNLYYFKMLKKILDNLEIQYLNEL
jgi:hypothetical protein